MKYPYMAFSDTVEIHPVFKGLTGDPLVVDLSLGLQGILHSPGFNCHGQHLSVASGSIQEIAGF